MFREMHTEQSPTGSGTRVGQGQGAVKSSCRAPLRGKFLLDLIVLFSGAELVSGAGGLLVAKHSSLLAT